MFSKLALKNVVRSLRDYSVYFLTLTFGVCIFYVFNSMDSQYVMDALRSSRSSSIPADLESSAPVGSSARIRAGRVMMARAAATRCRSPPEIW